MLRFCVQALVPARVAFSHVPLSVAVQRNASRYKWQFRPDLRSTEVKGDPKANPEEFKAKLIEGSTWYKTVEPDTIADRLSKMMATISYRLPNGGVRLGILLVLLNIATKPRHIRVAVQGLTLLQDRNPEMTFDPTVADAVVNAAIKIDAPEMGLAFLQMTWLRVWPSLTTVNKLIGKFSDKAQNLVLNRLLSGWAPKSPTFVNQKDKAADAEEEEPKEDTPALQEARMQKFVDAFMATYKEIRSDRHSWKPDANSFSLVVSFYSGLGDAEQALRLFKATHSADSKITDASIANLASALILAKRFGDAKDVLKNLARPQGLRALQAQRTLDLAEGNKDGVKATLSKMKSVSPRDLSIHFGVPERIAMLNEVVAELGESLTFSEEGKVYADGLATGTAPKEIVEEVEAVAEAPKAKSKKRK